MIASAVAEAWTAAVAVAFGVGVLVGSGVSDGTTVAVAVGGTLVTVGWGASWRSERLAGQRLYCRRRKARIR
ncbi:MAG TPA: hypothetical protein VGJ97_04325 [Anaerolineaceae bacterium]